MGRAQQEQSDAASEDSNRAENTEEAPYDRTSAVGIENLRSRLADVVRREAMLAIPSLDRDLLAARGARGEREDIGRWPSKPRWRRPPPPRGISTDRSWRWIEGTDWLLTRQVPARRGSLSRRVRGCRVECGENEIGRGSWVPRRRVRGCRVECGENEIGQGSWVPRRRWRRWSWF